ncbi:MAG TPA: radical SAM protein, partial [Symbiobacteriaceae bacterium]|nr:radical SAM protein [Symbiobacteriaceae bacterium]
MSVELRPFGVACNIQCPYCYQQPQREAGNILQPYDLDAMQAAVRREGGPFTLFGGEPLLLPLPELETILAWAHGEWGVAHIQTNGTL